MWRWGERRKMVDWSLRGIFVGKLEMKIRGSVQTKAAHTGTTNASRPPH